MRRREVLVLLGGPIVFAPEMVWAQSLRGMRRIGIMMQLAENDPAAQAQLTALSEGLAELGWEVGKNIQIEYRTTTSDPNTIASKASELILTRPEILLAVPFVNVAELRRQSPTTPLIFIHFADPVRLGLVDAIARPGGNTTGFMGFAPTMLEKWIELLKELSPTVERVIVLFSPSWLAVMPTLQPSGMQVTLVAAQNSREIELALKSVWREPHVGLVVLPGGPIALHRKWIMDAAAENRWPAVYGNGFYAEEGGLASYGASIVDQWRRAASYVHRILNGDQAGDLPVQFAIKFELVINLKTARALALTIPPTLLARADEVIE